MKTVKEIVDEINAKKLNTPYMVEDEIDADGIVEVATLDLAEYRGYTIGTIVFRIGKDFFGVRGAVALKSEESSWGDLGIECFAFEMIEVPSVTYKRKQ